MVLENLAIFQWNCRSLTTNFQYLIQYISEKQHPIICLTSLNVSWKALPKITGYFYPPVFSCKEIDGKIGAAIYIRSDLEYMNTPSPIPRTLENVHSVAIKLKISESMHANIISAYYSKGPNDENINWLRNLDQSENYIITGDFNAHSPLWDKNAIHTTNKKFVDNIIDSGLLLLNDGHITRVPDVSNHRASAIDLTLLSPALALDYQWFVEEDNLGSDHLPIITIVNEKLDIPQEEDTVPKYRYNCADWDKFKIHINAYNKEFLREENIDIAYTKFCDMIHNAARHSIPIQKSCTKQKTSGNIWWSKQCEEAVKIKKKALNEYNKDQKNEEKIKQKRQTNINSNRICAETRKQYIHDYMLREIKGPVDMPKVWVTSSKMKNGFRQPNCPIKVDKIEFPTKTDKAEEFAKFFSNVSNTSSLNKDEQEKRGKNEENIDFKNDFQNNDFFLNSNITLKEVKEAIAELGNKKSAVGIDGISYTLLNNLPEAGVECLHTIIQKSWESQLMPEIWKTSIVIPILKAGKNKSDKTNYRPISLTSHVSKIMEKIVLNRTNYYVEKNNILPHNQCGFRKNRSTTDHIVKLSNQIKHQFSKRKGILATFFDVRKAYDRVWHHRLLLKLKQIGFSGNILAFVKNFLSNRKITTKVGNSYSSLHSTNMGIPQGSILSPILFNLLLHDLPSTLHNDNIEIAQYADDLALWMKVTIRKKTYIREIKYYEKLYQINIDKLSEYMKNNGLEFSSEKTNLILFSNCQVPKVLPKIRLDSTVLRYVDEVKFLGVIFTRKLCWKKHIDYLCQKAFKSLNLLRYISSKPWGQDTSVLIHLATALVRSRLTYGQEAYFSAPKTYLNKIKSIDSKAYKIALGVPIHTKTSDVYNLVGILSIDEWRKLSCCKYLIRSSSIIDSDQETTYLRSESNFPKRSQKMAKIIPISNYTKDVFEEVEINPQKVSKKNASSPIPPWELKTATFDYEYTKTTKNENPNKLTIICRERLERSYKQHIQIFTDGSVSEDNNVGAGFVIPYFKISKSIHLGKGFSRWAIGVFIVEYWTIHYFGS